MKAIYYCILFVLGFIAIIGIFSEPEPALDMVRWTAVFVVSKSVGFAAGYIAYRLMVRWEKLCNQSKLTYRLISDLPANYLRCFRP